MALLEKAIARRWARAMLSLAQEQKAVTQLTADLDTLGKFVQSHGDGPLTLEIGRRLRWARTMLGLHQEKNAVTQVGADLESLACLMADHADLRHALYSPTFTLEQRRKVLGAVLDAKPTGAPAHPITVVLINLLSDKGRVPYIPLIAEMYRAEADRVLGQVRAQVWSAQALSREELAEIEQGLTAQAVKRKLGQKVLVNAGVDPSLLAGVKATLGGVVFDGTLKSHLQRMATALHSGT